MSNIYTLNYLDSVAFTERYFLYGHIEGGKHRDTHVSHMLFLSPSPVFEEPEDPSARSFFSEIISSVSDVKFSHSGRYLLTRDYLTAKVWDLNMESKPLETYQVRESE